VSVARAPGQVPRDLLLHRLTAVFPRPSTGLHRDLEAGRTLCGSHFGLARLIGSARGRTTRPAASVNVSPDGGSILGDAARGDRAPRGVPMRDRLVERAMRATRRCRGGPAKWL
jgi:hypothetical protein